MVNQFNKETEKIEREGKHNREKIYNFIFAEKKKGVKAGAIINHTRLSDQAVHKHLKILSNENRIYKTKGRRYFPEITIQNSFASFAQIMTEGEHYLIDKELMESNPDCDLPYELGKYPKLKLHQKMKRDFPEKFHTIEELLKAPYIKSPEYLMRMVSGQVAAAKYCRTSFGPKESLERCLFEFANRIGAYITYILLQSLHPLPESKLSDSDRGELSKIMLQKAITVEDLFTLFRYLMTQLGLTGCNLDSNNYEKLFQLSDNNFKTISKGLQNVYPNIYIGLENYCLHASWNNLALNTATLSTDCDHQWEKTQYFKYGSIYYCGKCHKSSLKKIKKKI